MEAKVKGAKQRVKHQEAYLHKRNKIKPLDKIYHAKKIKYIVNKN